LVVKICTEDHITKSEKAIGSFVISTMIAGWKRLSAIAFVSGEQATWDGGDVKFVVDPSEKGLTWRLSIHRVIDIERGLPSAWIGGLHRNIVVVI
jgi:hypothetical protein